MLRVLVTGGCGFIGSAVVRHVVRDLKASVINLDALTYAATRGSLQSLANSPQYIFVKGDVCDRGTVAQLLEKYRPNWILHLAAESHVDRSIDDPLMFVHTNVVGTATILDTALNYYQTLEGAERGQFRVVHVSTDEVFGSLPETGTFDRESRYNPSSPYSASKAGADHLARAWHRTYGLPVIVTSSSNNYGPFQFPEKLIPLMTLRACRGETLPVYGNGRNIRDWLYVEDHARALVRIAEAGKIGETYCVSGEAERRNIDVTHAICDLLDRKLGLAAFGARRSLVRFVTDRPAHDRRYAVNTTMIASELGWRPQIAFEQGLERTIDWYLDNRDWWTPLVESNQALARAGLSRSSG